jgi:transcriptional regulator with XRE-family HTH domain
LDRLEKRVEAVYEMTRLGQKIRELRTTKGMTQQRLAEKADVSHSLISALESGRRKYVSAPEIDRVAEALDLEAEDLWRLVPGGRSEARYIPITEPGQGGSGKTA